MNSSVSMIIICWVTLLFGFSQHAVAQTENLQLSLRAWIGEEGEEATIYSVNQQVILHIDVGTTRWFGAGTRIGRIDVPNLMVEQRSMLATNYAERKGGQTWSRQRWEITLYPQVSGNYQIPPIAVTVTVAAADGKRIEKKLYTNPLSFITQLPTSELTADMAWLASSQVTATQEWAVSNEPLHVGDTVTRTVIVDAQNTLSILIPNILVSSDSEVVSQAGVYQSYLAPPELTDTQNRGTYHSTRKEQVTYVLQRGGEIYFPEHKLIWWNTDAERLEHITLAGQAFSVSHTWRSWLRAYGVWLVATTVLLGMLLTILLSAKRYYRNHPLPLWLRFHLALYYGTWARARVLIYQKLRRDTGMITLQHYEAVDKSFNKQRVELPEDRHAVQFLLLWRRIKKQFDRRRFIKWLQPIGLEQALDLEQETDEKKQTTCDSND